MLVALERFDLRIPRCASLKEKRHVVKTLTAAIRSKFNVSVAEVDHHDLWQRTTLAVAVASGEQYHAKRVLHEVFVPAGEENGASGGQMVAVEMTRPPSATRNPVGRVLEVLGRLTDPGVDLKVIVAKYGLPDAFPPEVEEEARRDKH